MKTLKAGLIALAAMTTCGRVWAAASNPARLTIDVTVNTTLSVKVNSQASSTMTDTANVGGAPSVNTATATVASDATGVNEFWDLSSQDAVKKADGTTVWTLATSTFGAAGPASDKFALQAMFISSNAAAGDCTATLGPADAEWDGLNAPALTTGLQRYTTGAAGKFAHQTTITGAKGDPDFTAGGNDGRMRPSGFRGFCYRIVPPTDTSYISNVMLYLTVTASAS